MCFIEIGLLLIALPWSAFWDRNYFSESLPVLHACLTNNFARGAVSGLGLVNLYAGLVEIARAIAARRGASAASLHGDSAMSSLGSQRSDA